MRSKSGLLPIAAAFLLVLGCKEPTVKEVLGHARDRSYLKSCSARNHVVELRYLPRDLKLLMSSNIDHGTPVTAKLLDSLSSTEQSDAGLTFVLKLSPKNSQMTPTYQNDVLYGGIGELGGYGKTLEAYQFGMKEKIWMELDGNAYPVSNYQMENTFGMSPSRTFLISFAKPQGFAMGKPVKLEIVLDDIVPGLTRKKFEWTLPLGKYDQSI